MHAGSIPIDAGWLYRREMFLTMVLFAAKPFHAPVHFPFRRIWEQSTQDSILISSVMTKTLVDLFNLSHPGLNFVT